MSGETPTIILVTGASRGIGRAIAIELAGRGHEVVVHYAENDGAAKDTVAAIEGAGGTCRLLRFDIADRAACAAALGRDLDAHGAYYGVVLNAGASADQAFPMMTGEMWDRVLGTNLDGVFNVLHPVVMPMVRRRAPGRIVAISSVSALLGNRGQANYSAAKAGMIGAMKSLALELAKRRITVNCVAPGLIETDMTADLPLDEIKVRIPMRRLGTPEEVAKLVAFLCSEDAGYITRQVLAVDGGLT